MSIRPYADEILNMTSSDCDNDDNKQEANDNDGNKSMERSISPSRNKTITGLIETKYTHNNNENAESVLK